MCYGALGYGPAESGAERLNSVEIEVRLDVLEEKDESFSLEVQFRCADDQTADVVSDIALTRNDLLTEPLRTTLNSWIFGLVPDTSVRFAVKYTGYSEGPWSEAGGEASDAPRDLRVPSSRSGGRERHLPSLPRYPATLRVRVAVVGSTSIAVGSGPLLALKRVRAKCCLFVLDHPKQPLMTNGVE